MSARDVRKNINLFVDGRGYAGQLDEFNAPELTLKTEEYRAGGMDLPVDISMGMEKLTASFALISYDKDVLSLFGVAEGNIVPFVAREALESFDGTITAVVHSMRGKIVKIAPGASKAGDKPTLTVDISLNYYQLKHGDDVVHEIDADNMVRIVNGVDALAGIRAALGI